MLSKVIIILRRETNEWICKCAINYYFYFLIY